MEILNEIVQSTNFLIVMFFLVILLAVIVIVNIIKTRKVIKRYNNFISKLSKGANIESMMRNYIETVEKVKNENDEIRKQNEILEKNIMKCIQKVGLVRYNAFSDTGSDLSFALALLDFENNGTIINGLYSRDNATATYAKPIVGGKSTYTLSKEEIEALEKAKNASDKYYINV